MTFQADFASQDYFRNPAAAIEKLRSAGGVVKVRFPIDRQRLGNDHPGARRSGAQGHRDLHHPQGGR